MQIDYVARHIELDAGLRKFVEERLEKALRFLREPIELRVALEGNGGDKHLCAAELHVAHRDGALHARAENVEPREALSEAVATIEVQARRGRERAVARRRRASREAVADSHWPVDVLARESLRSGDRPRIVKTTRIAIEPMAVDQAAQRLDGSRHDFVVFLDSETGRISVLYKRKDEDYGLIAPEF